MVSTTQSRDMNDRRVALYLRSATARQADPDSSLACQRNVLLDLAARHNLRVVHEYRDAGISGQSPERPGLDQLLQDAQANPRRFDIVLVADLSRISRDVVYVMELSTTLEMNAIALVIADQLATTHAVPG